MRSALPSPLPFPLARHLTPHTHSRSLDLQPTGAPFIVCGGEDQKLNIYEGPPDAVKFTKSVKLKGTILWLGFDKSGERFASTGGGAVTLHDGNTGEAVGAPVKCEKSTSSMYSACLSPDGASCLTASADKTARVLDLAR